MGSQNERFDNEVKVENLFFGFVDLTGWNDRSQVIILLRYIASLDCINSFADFLGKQAQEEEEMGETLVDDE
jgi:hypothetical protein